MIWREPPASDLQKTRGFVYRALIRPLRRALTESDRCQREFYVSSSTSDVRFSPFLSKRWHISAAEGLRNEIILLLYGINVFNLLGSSCWGGTPSLEQPWDGGGQIELMVTRQMCFLFSDGFFLHMTYQGWLKLRHDTVTLHLPKARGAYCITQSVLPWREQLFIR